nr:endogenous retrovirus group K member 5 Gag polyprotein-like [Anas platyrhynchos]
MEVEAAVKLLSNILTMRGVACSTKNVKSLVTWAQKEGFLKETPQNFSPEEWQLIGDRLWQTSTKKGKFDTDLCKTWRLVIDALNGLKADRQVVMAATQALSAQSGAPKTSSTESDTSLSQLFPVDPMLTPVRGMTSSIKDLAAAIAKGLSEPGADAASDLPSSPPAPEKLDARPPASAPPPGDHKSTQGVSPPLSVTPASSTPMSTRWSGIIRDAILDGDLHASSSLACPVIVDSGQGTGSWMPHDWKLLQQARKTVTDYGLHSQAAQQIIHWIFQADLMCPFDCQNIARLLLTPSQLLIFEREWLQLAQIEASRPRQTGDPLYGTTVEMLTGTGPYFDPQLQLQFPEIVHRTAAQLALRALFALPGEKKAPPFASVHQAQGESYAKFIDRLWTAVMDHPDLSSDMKRSVLKMLAFDNANAKTQSILATLPKNAPIEEMLERVERVDQSKQAAVMAQAVASALGDPLAAIVSRSNGSPSRCNSQEQWRCYRCGRLGHLRRQCTATPWCDLCRSNTHATSVCRYQGNSKRSAIGRATTTVAAAQSDGADFLTAVPLPPEEASGWTWQQQ